MTFRPLERVFGDTVIAACFSEDAIIDGWLEVERGLALVQGELGVIPATAAAAIELEARLDRIDKDLLWREAAVVGYPILPLLDQIARASSEEVGRYLHWGATTQDIMDSGLALQLGRALDHIELLVLEFGNELSRRAGDTATTVMAGRTHAQHAVPITFGLKLAVWLSEITRHLERIRLARRRAATVQLFGAAGTAAALGPHSAETRRRLAQHLGLAMSDVPWQAARDVLAEVVFTLAALSATCAKLAREVIELSRPEIGEVAEPAARRRGASSTMPQKQNPVASEAVIGMSSIATSQVATLLTAMLGGHERAAGEWHMEWDAMPAAFAGAGGALAKACELVHGLFVFPDRMRANAESDGRLLMSERMMMHRALEIGRDAAHHELSDLCLEARESGRTLEQLVTERGWEPSLVADLVSLGGYLGESPDIVTAAVDGWQRMLAE